MPSFDWWRTVLWLIPTIAVYTTTLGTLSIGSSLFEHDGRFAHWCARAWSWLILATTGVDVEVRGLERIRAGATYVIVSNHQSIYDIPVLFRNMPYQLRIIAKASLGRFPFLGWHLRRAGHLLVDRSSPDPIRILKRWEGSVTRGLSLLVFPEGTRSSDGRVARFKGGSFLLAIRAGLPVVPVSVSGSRHVMRKGRLTTCPGLVRLTVHDPIETVGLEPSVENARRLAVQAHAVIEPDVDESWLSR